MLTETEVRDVKPVRYSRKVTDGKGLYLQVTPKGGRSWYYAYRFGGKYKKLFLGTIPQLLSIGQDRVTCSLATWCLTALIRRR
jgi:hypothetical protein